MDDDNHGAIWLASYPKSGNTWLRCLLEAYRRNGKLDLNDIRITSSDGGATLIRGVSPIPLEALGLNGQLLLRPAALLNLFCRLSAPIWVKTHFANIQPDGLPHLIPVEWTKKAVYIVRDPRAVVLSLASYFQLSVETAVATMTLKNFTIGDNKNFASVMVSSWSNHVSSWVGEKRYPVHIVKYEDMVADAGKELAEVLEFLGEEVDQATIKIAVEATEIAQLAEKEGQTGFHENVSARGAFFNGGGSRWEDELGPKWIKQIEADHGEVMRVIGYLEGTVSELHSVN